MLETLDSFDWLAVGAHMYGNNERIPQYIRALAIADYARHGSACSFLFGLQEDFSSTICATTAPIIRFTLEILADESIPNADLLLNCYASVLQSKVYTSRRHSYSIQQVRDYLAAYDAVEAGLSLYLARLESSDPVIRRAAAAVLGGLSASSAVVLPALSSHFRAEGDQNVKRSLISAINRCLKELDDSGDSMRKQYASFFADIVDSDTSLELRYAAAVASIEASVNAGLGLWVESKDLPMHTTDVLLEAFWCDHEIEYLVQMRQQEIVRLLSTLRDETPLVLLLKMQKLSPEQAHLVASGLLAHSFVGERIWHESFDRDQQGHFYQVRANGLLHQGKLYPEYRPVLTALIESEAFWSQPTNLFSHFLGLSDNREALRALLSD